MAKSKKYFGDYTINGVFGGKPSARSRKATKDDFTQLGGMIIPAIALIGFVLYKRNQAKSGTMSLTDKPVIATK